MTDDPRLVERMKRLSASRSLSPAARDRHRAMIRQQLDEPTVIVPPRGGEEPRSRKAVLIAAMLAITGGALFASGAIGDDAPLSSDQTVERTLSVPDDEMLAEDRLNDLENLIDGGSTRSAIVSAQNEAFIAIQGFGDDHPTLYRYEGLVLGARRGDDGLDLNYLYEGPLRWTDDEIYRSSLPSGDLVTIEREGSGYRLSASGRWSVDQSGDDRWFVSELDADGEPAVFELRIVGEAVRAQLLDSTLVVASVGDADADGVGPVEQAPDGTTSAEGPGPSAAPATTTSTVDPPDKTTTTTRPTTSTSATTIPTTTTEPSTTTTLPPTTAPTTTIPQTTTSRLPTTVCDDGFDDDDECDD